MKIIFDECIDNVVNVLNKEKLFRYDCKIPEDSEVSCLENDFTKLTGFKYAVAMNSCSSAIFISLLCAGVRPGDKVMLPAFTFIAVPSSIIHANAVPVLVDVDDNYVIDMGSLAEVYEKENANFLLLSHMRGRVANMDELLIFCNTHDIKLVEDCAHSLGVLWNGRQAGYHGIAASFSMQSYKMLDGGEGGVLCTNDMDVAIKSMLYAGCYETNWSKHYLTEEGQKLANELVNQLPAYNFRMSNLTAAAIRPQLKQLEDRIQKYNNNYDCFINILDESPYIRIPQFTTGSRPASDTCQFQILTDNKEKIREIIQNLEAQGITLSVFGFSEKNARAFWRWGFCNFPEGKCNKTKNLLLNTADIRLRLAWDKREISRIANIIFETIDSVLSRRAPKVVSF
ncbi:MAG: aminotransferase class I/II-fold pyridoxal phosphate-dependent enzyme [Gammaproteobacteria bacterium]|nr:aminotransferase class I/II-fold pyridoxal phosphate-dependent enzyme [Gammaproteobacteria bacterium]